MEEVIGKADTLFELDDRSDTLETKWTSLSQTEQNFFRVRYDYCRMLVKQKRAALKEVNSKPKPHKSAAEKRTAANTLAEAKGRERGEILLRLGTEFGDSRVEELIAKLDIDWYRSSDKWVRIVRLYLQQTMDRVDLESQRRWGAPPRYLELSQLTELEAHFSVADSVSLPPAETQATEQKPPAETSEESISHRSLVRVSS